jgi:hypothetical protein
MDLLELCTSIHQYINILLSQDIYRNIHLKKRKIQIFSILLPHKKMGFRMSNPKLERLFNCTFATTI